MKGMFGEGGRVSVGECERVIVGHEYRGGVGPWECSVMVMS